MLKIDSMTVVGASARSPEKFGYRVVKKLVGEDAREVYVVHPDGEDICFDSRTVKSFRNLPEAPPTDNLAFYIPRKLIFDEKPSPEKYGAIWVPPVDGILREEGLKEEGEKLKEHFRGLGYDDEVIFMDICYLRGR